MCINYCWNWFSTNSSNIIAVCALILTIWQAFVTRRHNKLSVVPYLTTWSNSGDKGLFRVDIINNGIGPALIQTFQVFVDGHEIVGQDLEIIRKALKILFPNYVYNSYNSFLSQGYMMSPKESRCLLEIQFTGNQFPTPEEIEHATKRTKIYIKYESIYKEKLIYDSSKFKVLN